MIKFFRNIRKTLLGEGNTTNYLKYAIGEIVLVVIGILIALQINNWKTDRTDRKEEAFYLQKLRQNLSQDTLYLSQRTNQMDRVLSSLKAMDEQSKDPLLERFSDSVNVVRLLSIFNFSPQTSTFDNLISTGKLALLTNQSLVDSLFVYYNDLNNYTKQLNEGINVYSRNTIAPYLLEFDDIRNPRRKPIDYGNETFIKNVIELKIGLINTLKRRYGNASKRCLNIFEMIDAQLHD